MTMDRNTASAGRKFKPMRNSFAFLYGSITILLMAFIASGFWYSWKIHGLEETINLAGSQRMRVYQISYTLSTALGQSPRERALAFSQAMLQIQEADEIFAALKYGSSKYQIRDFSGESTDKVIDAASQRWSEEIKTRLSAIILAEPAERASMVSDLSPRLHEYVEKDLNQLVLLMVHEGQQADTMFKAVRLALTFMGLLAVGLNIIYVRRKILVPVNRLMADTEEVARGNYSVVARVDTDNELMLLAGRFNDMTASVGAGVENLEEKVKTRTRELDFANARMNAFFESAADAIISIDPYGRILSFSGASETMFGYRSDEVIGLNINILMPEPFHSEHDKYLAAYRGTGKRKVIGSVTRSKAKRKDGSVFDMEIAVSEARLASGAVFNGVIRDISARVAAEREAAKLRNAIEQSEDSVVITDRDGTIEYVNAAFERVTGYTAAEAIGKNPRVLKSGKHPASFFEEMWRTLVGGNIWRGEIINRKKGGELYYENATISPVKDEKGEIIQFVAIKSDISERKRTEKDLADKNAELERRSEYDAAFSRIMSIFASTFDRKNAVGQMLEVVSERLPFPCAAFYAYDDWKGRLVLDARRGLTEGLKEEFGIDDGIVGQSVKSGKTLFIESSEEFPLLIETGLLSIRPYAVVVQPVMLQERIIGVLVLASVKELSDFERHFIDRLGANLGISLEGLRQYGNLKELSRQLKLRSDEISMKNLQLEEANKMKSEFLANMSHELRTPLNAIIGFSELIKDGMLGELTLKQRDYVSEIFTSGHHLLDLINDILDLSKIDAGKMTLDREVIDISGLLTNSLAIVREKAAVKNIRLEAHLADDLGTISIDARRFKQVIYNLLSNAVKFTGEKGAVTVEGSRKFWNGAWWLEVSVRDTGIGISREGIDKLFRPFEQLDGSLARKYEGTGLGLAMVKRLAELHGGMVEVDSEPGKGSVFTVRIPYVIDEGEERPLPDERFASTGLGVAGGRAAFTPTILLIEDDEASARMLQGCLEREGFIVAVAHTGSKGEEMAHESLPDLIVLDLILPDIDGIDLLNRLKGDYELGEIPVLVISMKGDEARGFCVGAEKVLQKPVSRGDVIFAMSEIIPHDPAAKRTKVQVVDDDPKAVNIISSHFEAVGCEVIRCYGGQEAIDTARIERPDLMVVDLMMPEVTGFDVVTALKERAETASIPIVILTAKIITDEDRKNLNGSILKIIQKEEFSAAAFIRDIRTLMRHGISPRRDRRSAVPAAFSGQERRGKGRERKDIDNRKKVVLVVDDDKNQSEILKAYLEGNGYGVTQAFDGKDALDKLAQNKVDLITLDLMMPEMDGFEFLDAKARNKQLAAIPVIIVSAMGQDGQGRHLGANAFLAKPVERFDLVKLAGSLMKKRRAGEKGRILVVDDDPRAVKIISSYLEGENYEATSAYSGQEGIEYTASWRPDLIVLDLMMPDMSGFEVLDHLKRNDSTRAIPVVIMTAKILTAEERNGLMGRVENIFSKGAVSRNDFLREVDVLIGGKA
ncbi:MAG: response regulator [Nitrospirota bacterium]|nr:response regulator [Nitrospirota bacterium]